MRSEQARKASLKAMVVIQVSNGSNTGNLNNGHSPRFILVYVTYESAVAVIKFLVIRCACVGVERGATKTVTGERSGCWSS